MKSLALLLLTLAAVLAQNQDLDSIIREIFEESSSPDVKNEDVVLTASTAPRRAKRQAQTGYHCSKNGRSGTCVPFYRCTPAGHPKPPDSVLRKIDVTCLAFIDVCCPNESILSESTPIPQDNLTAATLSIFKTNLKPLLLNNCYYYTLEALKHNTWAYTPK